LGSYYIEKQPEAPCGRFGKPAFLCEFAGHPSPLVKKMVKWGVVVFDQIKKLCSMA